MPFSGVPGTSGFEPGLITPGSVGSSRVVNQPIVNPHTKIIQESWNNSVSSGGFTPALFAPITVTPTLEQLSTLAHSDIGTWAPLDGLGRNWLNPNYTFTGSWFAAQAIKAATVNPLAVRPKMGQMWAKQQYVKPSAQVPDPTTYTTPPSGVWYSFNGAGTQGHPLLSTTMLVSHAVQVPAQFDLMEWGTISASHYEDLYIIGISPVFDTHQFGTILRQDNLDQRDQGSEFLSGQDPISLADGGSRGLVAINGNRLPGLLLPGTNLTAVISDFLIPGQINHFSWVIDWIAPQNFGPLGNAYTIANYVDNPWGAWYLRFSQITSPARSFGGVY